MPLCDRLGISAHVLTPERVVLSVDWEPELCTSDGLLHGGTVMALADSAGGATAFLNLPDGATATSTIESSTNFLGAVTAETLTATGRPCTSLDDDRRRDRADQRRSPGRQSDSDPGRASPSGRIGPQLIGHTDQGEPIGLLGSTACSVWSSGDRTGLIS